MSAPPTVISRAREVGAGSQIPDLHMLTVLSENQSRQAMARWDALQPCLSEGVPLTRAAAAPGVPVRTARRWLAAYRSCGLAGLAPTPRADPGITLDRWPSNLCRQRRRCPGSSS
jgi:hypothetical protein